MASVKRRENESRINAAAALLGPSLARGFGGSQAIITRTRCLTYDELDVQASRFAGVCAGLRFARLSRVLILMHDHCDFVAVYLGVMKAGFVPAALNVRLSAGDLGFIIKDSGARLIVLDHVLLSLFEEAVAAMAEPPKVIVRWQDEGPGRNPGDYLNLEAQMQRQPAVFEPVLMRPDDMALWMYSSGTTGRPKAVVHLQKSILTADRYFGPIYGVGPGSRVYCTSKLFFAFTLGHCLLAALRLGATIILFDGWPSPQAVCAVAEEFRPSIVLSVPSMYRALLKEGLGTSCFASVRLFVSAGERLPGSTYSEWRKATGREICEGVGATETLTMFLGNSPHQSRAGVSGTLLPQTAARLLNDAGDEIKEAGTPGVLWVRMPGIAAGYWNCEEMTRQAFKDGWYCTGDMFTRDDEGRYSYTGRADDMMKISGQWVSPLEIEETVLQNPHISEAAAVGVKNADGFTRLALCLVVKDGAPGRGVLEDNLLEEMKSKLSIYKCPRRFVYLDEMPRTATGKLQRFRLRRIAAKALGMGPG